MNGAADAEVIGKRIEHLRKQAGFETQSSFADAIGVRPHVLWRYENGKGGRPSIDVLCRMAAKLGTTVDDLVAPSESGESESMDDNVTLAPDAGEVRP